MITIHVFSIFPKKRSKISQYVCPKSPNHCPRARAKLQIRAKGACLRAAEKSFDLTRLHFSA